MNLVPFQPYNSLRRNYNVANPGPAAAGSRPMSGDIYQGPTAGVAKQRNSPYDTHTKQRGGYMEHKQPLLRGPDNNYEVPSQLPRRPPRCHCRNSVLPIVLPLAKRSSSPWRHSHATPRRRPQRWRPACPRTAEVYAARGLVATPRTLRSRIPQAPSSPQVGFDQPTEHGKDAAPCPPICGTLYHIGVDRYRIRHGGPDGDRCRRHPCYVSQVPRTDLVVVG